MKAPSAALAIEWAWDRWSTTPVFAAGSRVMLRELGGLIAVDRAGTIAWRRATPAAAVMVGLPDGSVAVAAEARTYVIDRDGHELPARSVATTVLAGAPGGVLGDLVWAVGFAGMAIVRDDSLAEVELEGRHRVKPERMAVDPQGRLWKGDDSTWSVHERDGRFVFAVTPEGIETEWSFPPAWVGDRPWLFRWQAPGPMELVALDPTACAMSARDVRLDWSGLDRPGCITSRLAIGDFDRAPIVAHGRDVVVASFGSVGGATPRTLVAYRDGAALWTRKLGGFGAADPMVVCGGTVAVLHRDVLGRYDLETGAPLATAPVAGVWLACVGEDIAIVDPWAVEFVSPP